MGYKMLHLKLKKKFRYLYSLIAKSTHTCYLMSACALLVSLSQCYVLFRVSYESKLGLINNAENNYNLVEQVFQNWKPWEYGKGKISVGSLQDDPVEGLGSVQVAVECLQNQESHDRQVLVIAFIGYGGDQPKYGTCGGGLIWIIIQPLFE